MHAWMLIIVGLVPVSACAAGRLSMLDACLKNEPCRIEGMLVIESLWQASLDHGNECVALALPKDFFERRHEFNGKNASVIGDVASQPSDGRGRFSYSYEIDGVRVNSNLCGKVVVVKRIDTVDGASWVSGGPP